MTQKKRGLWQFSDTFFGVQGVEKAKKGRFWEKLAKVTHFCAADAGNSKKNSKVETVLDLWLFFQLCGYSTGTRETSKIVPKMVQNIIF